MLKILNDIGAVPERDLTWGYYSSQAPLFLAGVLVSAPLAQHALRAHTVYSTICSAPLRSELNDATFD